MPWNDNKGGGGPWGSGAGKGNGDSPWGKPPGDKGGPNEPPERPADLEESLRRMQERFKRRGSGAGGGGGRQGSGGGRGFGSMGVALILIIGLVGWLMTGIYQVNEQERAVVLRFGEFHRIEEPGFKIRFPNPIEDHISVPVNRLIETQIGNTPQESLMLTGDENIVDIDFSINWRINSPQQYLFNVVDVVNGQNELIRQVGESAMREIVGTSAFEPITNSDRTGVETRVRELMQTTLDSYEAGVEVVSISLKEATAPPEVVEVQRDVTNAEQDRARRINEAAQYRNQVVPNARGDAQRILQEAEGYKASQVAIARGEADRFKLIYDEYRKAPRVTRERMFLETMERVMGNSEQIILDTKSGAVPILSLDQLRGTRSQAPARVQGEQ